MPRLLPVRRLLTRASVLATLAALSAALAVPAAAASWNSRQLGEFHRTLTVAGPAQLRIVTGGGDIVIGSAPANQVIIDATIYGDESWRDQATRIVANPPVVQAGTHLIVGELHYPGGVHVSISYRIQLPEGSSIVAHSGSGQIRLTGRLSDADLTTGSGDISVENGAAITAHSGSGDIKVGRATGFVRLASGSGGLGVDAAASAHLSTGSGDIRASDIDGDLEAGTGSGGIDVSALHGSLRASTGSGDIHVQGSPRRAGDWQAHCGSGGIVFIVPRDLAARVQLRAHSGSVRIEPPLAVAVQGKARHNEVAGTLGNAGAPNLPFLNAESGSGDITLRAQ